MGTLAEELATHAGLPDGPRIYADANVPAGVVAFMRQRLHWDVLYVIEHDDLRRAPDRRHFALARQLQRTLITLDHDFLDDQRFPPDLTGGVIVCSAPDERMLRSMLTHIDRVILRAPDATESPLKGRKLLLTPEMLFEP